MAAIKERMGCVRCRRKFSKYVYEIPKPPTAVALLIEDSCFLLSIKNVSLRSDIRRKNKRSKFSLLKQNQSLSGKQYAWGIDCGLPLVLN